MVQKYFQHDGTAPTINDAAQVTVWDFSTEEGGTIVGGYLQFNMSQGDTGTFRGQMSFYGLILGATEAIPAATTAVLNELQERVYFACSAPVLPLNVSVARIDLRTKRTLRRNARLVVIGIADGTGSATTLSLGVEALLIFQPV